MSSLRKTWLNVIRTSIFWEFFSYFRTVFEDSGIVKDIQKSTQFAWRFRKWLRQIIEGAVAEMVAVGGIGIR